jgi:hypothetical protein
LQRATPAFGLSGLIGLALAGSVALGSTQKGAPVAPALAVRQTQASDTGPSHTSALLPEHLSDTGLYVAGSTSVVAPENLAFVPQYPLWSDGAVKHRYVRLPAGVHIDASNADDWQFPVGTRFWKELGFERRVETRYIERRANGGWAYASYVWNEQGTDAVRAPERGVRGAHPLAGGLSHDVPGVGDCKACHEGRPGRVLGFNALQLSHDVDLEAANREAPLPDAVDLAELIGRGLVRNLPSELVARAPRIAARSNTERAALGYLFGNCSNCHNGAGPLAALGLDFDVSVLPGGVPNPALATSLGRPSQYRPAGVERALRIAEGHPLESTVALRMSSRKAAEQMPPLGTRLVDPKGIALIERWITEDL